SIAPGQSPKAKTPHSDAPNSWKAVVIGIAREEPTIVNTLNVTIGGLILIIAAAAVTVTI
ncbi:hypothetical protein WP50_32330, partial [Lactiplantibacillus plantarum]